MDMQRALDGANKALHDYFCCSISTFGRLCVEWHHGGMIEPCGVGANAGNAAAVMLSHFILHCFCFFLLPLVKWMKSLTTNEYGKSFR